MSGLMWTGVGILLVRISLRWFVNLSSLETSGVILTGLIGGYLISSLGFSNLADKNIKRILEYNDKVCPFAFQKWQSYILILFMISLGVFMRKSHLIPPIILAPMYISIGLGLFFASFRYHLCLYKYNENQEPKC